jgi:hypothetical protein
MNLRRDCLHEAGHFYVAFLYNPLRAVSICVSTQVHADPLTGELYRSIGQAVTLDPIDSNPRVLITIRAGGLAAESIIYEESFEDLMANPEIRFRIKTDTDNARRDLERAGLVPTGEEQFVSLYWRIGFHDAVTMMGNSQEKLERIADYCQVNLDREIPGAELARNCDL